MKTNKDIIWFFFFLALFSLGLCSCSTLEKRIDKAKVIAYENPKSFADFCANAFPIVPTYIKGKDSVITNTVTVKGDSIPCPAVKDQSGKEVINKVKCPDVEYKEKIVTRVDTIREENTAKLDTLSQRYDKLDKSYKEIVIAKQKLDDRATARLYWIIGLGLLSAMAIYMVIRTR